jgi:hypothetical protein
MVGPIAKFSRSKVLRAQRPCNPVTCADLCTPDDHQLFLGSGLQNRSLNFLHFDFGIFGLPCFSPCPVEVLYDEPRYVQYHCYGTPKTRKTKDYLRASLEDVVQPRLFLPLVPILLSRLAMS